MLAAARASQSVELRYQELMSPTVRVNARHEVGSGTILWSKSSGKRARTFILTAWHIVQDNMPEEGSNPLEVDFYDSGDLLRTEVGKIACRDEGLDLALLEVRGYNVYPRKARLPRRSDLRAIRIFAKVYAIGCPLGVAPLPAYALITGTWSGGTGPHDYVYLRGYARLLGSEHEFAVGPLDAVGEHPLTQVWLTPP